VIQCSGLSRAAGHRPSPLHASVLSEVHQVDVVAESQDGPRDLVAVSRLFVSGQQMFFFYNLNNNFSRVFLTG